MRESAKGSRAESGRVRGGLGRIALAVALAIALPTTEASAQVLYRDQMRPGGDRRPPRSGGGGIGPAIGIGIGLGIVGAAIARSRAEEEARPRRHVVEEDDPRPTPRRTPRTKRTETKAAEPPKRRPPATRERAALPEIRIPPPSEDRFRAGEVLVELKPGGAIGPLARRLDLTIVESRDIDLTGTTLHRLVTKTNRSTAETLRRLRRERTVAHAQPNWVYTLQEETAPPTVEPIAGHPVEEAPAAPAATVPTPTAAPPASRPAGGTEATGPTATVAAVPVGSSAAAATPAATPVAVGSEPAAVGTKPAVEAPTPLPGQWGSERIRLGAVRGIASGRGVRIAVIDTAVDATHPELAGAVEESFDALPAVDPAPGAHGTAMAGAIAARLRLAGVAPGARLLTARAFGPPGADGIALGSTFEVVACLDWAVKERAQVVSMSFAGPASGVLARALAAARAKGVVLVAASGNAGPKSAPLHPAADPGVVAVTASDPDDRVLPEAVRGAHVLLTAPGVDVLVPSPKGGYDLTSGTSIAAAEVAGVVALVLEKRPDLRPDEVAGLLARAAVDLGAPGRDPVFGAGLVDVEAVLGRVR